MLTPSLFSLLFFAAFVAQGDAQGRIQYDSIHNATSLSGTWSTGSGAVSTGPGFANPRNYSFIYPKTAGRSFSFTDDGFFEQAEYRFTSNASDPHCITGVVTWQHGNYQLLDNGSMLLSPFSVDGRQQVQDPCAAISNQLTQWNTTILFQSWRIFPLSSGGVHLNLYEFDGSPVAPMILLANPPTMLPTSTLTQSNETLNAPAAQTGPAKRDREFYARSGASPTALIAASLAGLAGLGSLLVLLP